MPALTFCGPNLAITAYAEVDGATGTATRCNSGITTTRVGQGVYVLLMPANLTGKGLFLAQSKSITAKMLVVDDHLDATKTIYVWSGDPTASGSTTVDGDFSIVILRTTLPPSTAASSGCNCSPCPECPPVPPAPSPPATDALIFWSKGDSQLSTPTDTRVDTWGNLATAGGNSGFGVGAPYPNDAPYALHGDTIDGIQLVTFGVAGDANKGMRTGGSNPDPATNLNNHVGAPMDGSSPRTVMMMGRPDWQAAFARLGGNPLVQSNYGCIFSIWGDAAPENGTAWSHAWQSIDVKWSTPLGPGSVFNGAPTLMEWRTDVFPNFEFLVNNVLTPTTPSDLSTWIPAGVGPLFLGGPGNPSYLGGVTEILIWDRKLTILEHLQAILYFMSRYPSAPIVV